MEFDSLLRAHLVDLLRGGNAHMDLHAAVTDFPDAMINTRPANVAYTFWHILEHLRITQADILNYLTNAAYKEPHWPIDYWPAPGATASREQWDETIGLFGRDLDVLITMVQDESVDLFGSVPSNDEHTVLREILIVADHNAYHIGEFGILRQVENAWGPGHE